MESLVELAALIKQKTLIDSKIAAMIGRPAQLGHIGEYVASKVFGIALNDSASAKGSDGWFKSGPLNGRTVDVKWYGKREGLLDINPDGVPDYYLVFTGPKTAAGSSRGTTRPWVIEAVYLFDAPRLVKTLTAGGLRVGIATSVKQEFWDEAEIYPVQRNRVYVVSDEQRRDLALFGP
ncbi:MAG: hypothetical protein ACM3X4_00565 [Ignavibacteriales bacterium]